MTIRDRNTTTFKNFFPEKVFHRFFHRQFECPTKVLKVFHRFFHRQMQFELTIEDYTIILNALHYYKKVEKRGNFQQYDEKRINELRDKLSKQFSPYFHS